MKDETKGASEAMEKIEHKPVRVIMKWDADKEISPEVQREDELVDWAQALHHNAMRIAAAGVLAATGSLEKAASVLEWARFAVPPGYFPEGHEGDDYFPHEEEVLQLWVEEEAGKIEGVTETVGFYLAGSGKLLDRLDEHTADSDEEGGE